MHRFYTPPEQERESVLPPDLREAILRGLEEGLEGSDFRVVDVLAVIESHVELMDGGEDD